MKTIEKAVKYFGGQTKLSKVINVRQDQVSKWVRHISYPSTKSAVKIEKATKGHVTAKAILTEKFKLQIPRKVKLVQNKIKKEKD